MNQAQLYRLADRALSGRLAEILADYRDQNLSPGRMALRLAAEHQVEVSGPTLKKWVASLPPRRATGAPTAQTAQTPQTAKLAPVARAAQTAGPHVAVAS
jgi:hypothetical protein